MILVMSRSIAYGAIAGIATAACVCSGLLALLGLGLQLALQRPL
jgi:threonine/homoserine/homoserine lactone efflux protein